MRLSKKSLVGIFVIFIFSLLFGVYRFLNTVPQPIPVETPAPQPQLRIGETVLTVELADTPEERAQGLSNRQPLPPNHGMLFIFDEAQVQTFWMKDMQFPLDFVWIHAGVVIQTHENVPLFTPSEDIQTIHASAPIDSVLEVPAGFIAEHHIEVGDPVTIP